MLKTAIQKVVDGVDLGEEEMVEAMDVIMSGQATPAQIGAFITALRLPEPPGSCATKRLELELITPW